MPPLNPMITVGSLARSSSVALRLAITASPSGFPWVFGGFGGRATTGTCSVQGSSLRWANRTDRPTRAFPIRICEHMFVGESGSPGAKFWRAIGNQNVIAAEAAAFEMKQTYPLPLDFAIALVDLYAEKRDPKFEPAALRYLERYITEARPSLVDLAAAAALLAERVAR